MSKLSIQKLAMFVCTLLGLTVGGAGAQTISGQGSAPTQIAPLPAQREWERAERAREDLRYQQERDRLDLEARRLRNQAIEERQDDRQNALGAPTFIGPDGATLYTAPQYPGAAPAYGYAAPYGADGAVGYAPTGPPPAAGGMPNGAAQACRQMAPAYDQAGRFLGNLCLR